VKCRHFYILFVPWSSLQANYTHIYKAKNISFRHIFCKQKLQQNFVQSRIHKLSSSIYYYQNITTDSVRTQTWIKVGCCLLTSMSCSSALLRMFVSWSVAIASTWGMHWNIITSTRRMHCNIITNTQTHGVWTATLSQAHKHTRYELQHYHKHTNTRGMNCNIITNTQTHAICTATLSQTHKHTGYEL